MRLLKAFTAYYKQLTIDKKIEQLKLEGKANSIYTSWSAQQDPVYQYKPLPIKEMPTPVKKMQFKKYNRLPLPVKPAIEGLDATNANLEKIKLHSNGMPKSKPHVDTETTVGKSEGWDAAVKEAGHKKAKSKKPALRFL